MEFVKELSDWLENVLKQLDPKAKLSLKYPWEALKILDKLTVEKESIQGQIETGVKWDVPFILGKNSVLKAPTVIEGPVIIGENSIIGPFAYLRGPCIIGSDCKIGSAEIKNSIIMDGSHCAHFNYVGDSIVGKRCNLGAGTKLANLRFDGDIIKMGRDKKSTGLRKLGAVLESGSQTGCNSVLNPGTYVAKKGAVLPGSVVSGFVDK
ncbi:MAG: glucose-1-phosphate thymidylyltransferase [Candidatus Woesearchaeota archaeon]|nr:glucose-1-phosphate thymidylyltransferase [Candidatus Woesearchaeota archaeon]